MHSLSSAAASAGGGGHEIHATHLALNGLKHRRYWRRAGLAVGDLVRNDELSGVSTKQILQIVVMRMARFTFGYNPSMEVLTRRT